MEQTFAGKSCVVTGGTSGIGLAVAHRLARAGGQVLATGRDIARARAATGNDHMPGIDFHAADLVDRQAPEEIVAAAAAVSGRIDVLVHCAGVLQRGTVLDTVDHDWDFILDLNISAPMRMMRAVLPSMIAQGGGVIIHIASDWALRPARNAVAYSATKAALVQMVRCAALDHGGDNVRVNAVCPGDTDTPMLGAGLTGTARQAWIDQCARAIPLGRVGTPDDVAALVAFVASDAASWITGACLSVDGGAVIA